MKNSNELISGFYISEQREQNQTLEIEDLGNGKYAISLFVGSEGCIGKVPRSEAILLGNKLIFYPGSTCKPDITCTGDMVIVEELDCIDYHGANCNFSGIYRRQKAL